MLTAALNSFLQLFHANVRLDECSKIGHDVPILFLFNKMLSSLSILHTLSYDTASINNLRNNLRKTAQSLQ
jgi:hypothetical protein